jgi:hypothetical protein
MRTALADTDNAAVPTCGIAVMAKASIPGRTKTRLVPPLTFEEAAQYNTAFLRDVADICVTVRPDMDASPDAPPYDHSLVAGENAAADLFADLLLEQGGEPAEAHQCRHNVLPNQDSLWRRTVDAIGGRVECARPSRRMPCVAARLISAPDRSALTHRRWPSGKPRLRAFCRSAPAVRFMALTIFLTGDLLRECALSSRMSSFDQGRRLVRRARLVAINPSRSTGP